MYEFDPTTNFIPKKIYEVDSLLSASVYSYNIQNNNAGELLLIFLLDNNVAKINTVSNEIEYVDDPIFSNSNKGPITSIQENNNYITISSSSSMVRDLIINLSTFDTYNIDSEFSINDTLVFKHNDLYNPYSRVFIPINKSPQTSLESSFDIQIEPWEYYYSGNYLYVIDNQHTRNKLMQYDISTHFTVALHNQESRLIKMDKENAVAYLLDDDGIKKFILE